jgi:glycosyltransferase involved in cell wall biosynthesis
LSQNELAKILRISDVFLLTSSFEGMPMSVLEALACGLPVVTTKAGEVGLVVKDNFSGFVCRERSANVLAETVLKVLEGNKNIFLENCSASIQKYTAEHILNNFCEELSNIQNK